MKLTPQNSEEQNENDKDILCNVFSTIADEVNLFIGDINSTMSYGFEKINSKPAYNSTINDVKNIKDDIVNNIDCIEKLYQNLNTHIQYGLEFIKDSIVAPSHIDLSMNCYEDDNEYIYEIEIPGVPIADINIDEHDGTIKISGEKKLKRSDNLENYKVVEINIGTFSKIIQLQDDADIKSIKAQSRDGLLSLMVQKMNNK